MQKNQPEHVLDTMTPQLVPGDRASNPALPANDVVDIDDGTEDDMTHGGRRSKSSAALRRVMAQRLVEARALNGISQSEAATMPGFCNGTQVSLWEQARRPVPLQLVSHIATTFGVSTDWLLGTDDEPERNSRLAARNHVVRRMAGLLERNAQVVADALDRADFRAEHALTKAREALRSHD